MRYLPLQQKRNNLGLIFIVLGGLLPIHSSSPTLFCNKAAKGLDSIPADVAVSEHHEHGASLFED